jgi:hypothetical protein
MKERNIKNLTALLQNLCQQEINIKVNRIHKTAMTHLENRDTPVWSKLPTLFNQFCFTGTVLKLNYI